MARFATKLVLGAATAASVLTAVVPAASAQDWRGYHYGRHDHGDGAGAAIVAGIAGLAIGAALTSHRNDDDPPVYRERRYYPADGYWYRDDDPGYPTYEVCTFRRVWDPYLGYPVRVRYCQ
jgi:hypothetical protein